MNYCSLIVRIVRTQSQLKELGLNERQIKAVLFVKDSGKITNKEYQELNNTTDRTALRDLEKLVEFAVFKRIGEKKGAFYELGN